MVAERLGDNQAWFCHQNFDQNFSTCEDPQELEDDEIDVLMQAQEKRRRGRAVELGVSRKCRRMSGLGLRETFSPIDRQRR